MGNDSVIYIRTDGNSKIATGHFVRCLCIAQALEEMGKKVCFLVSDHTSFELLKDLCNTVFDGVSFSFDTRILESAVFDNLDLEIDELCSFLGDRKHLFDDTVSSTKITSKGSNTKPIILVDSYYVTEAYFQSLNQVASVAYMDDLRSFDYDVDLVINYDVIPPSKEEEYKQAYTKAKTCLLGAAYTPLREQFQNQSVELRDQIQNILVTTGGSDPYKFTESISSFLISEKFSVDIHIVVGRLFQNIETLEALSIKYPHVHLHQNIKDMASLMKQCDFAISAAGTTLYELCALGIPTISFTFADNQMIMAETFHETGAIPYMGDLRESSSICDKIYHHLENIINHPNLLQSQQQKMQYIVDGNGSIKIAEALINLSVN